MFVLVVEVVVLVAVGVRMVDIIWYGHDGITDSISPLKALIESRQVTKCFGMVAVA